MCIFPVCIGGCTTYMPGVGRDQKRALYILEIELSKVFLAFIWVLGTKSTYSAYVNYLANFLVSIPISATTMPFQ